MNIKPIYNNTLTAYIGISIPGVFFRADCACLASISSYKHMVEKVFQQKELIIFLRKNNFYFDFEVCEAFCREITEMGFPVSIVENYQSDQLKKEENKFLNECYSFVFDVEKMNGIIHILATLCLIRCLFERGICDAPLGREILLQKFFELKSDNLQEKWNFIINFYKKRHNSHAIACAYSANIQNSSFFDLKKFHEELIKIDTKNSRYRPLSIDSLLFSSMKKMSVDN